VSKQSFKNWYKSGEPGIWISGGAVAISVIMTIGLIAVIAVRGLGHFWPSDVIEARYSVPGQPVQMLLGELVQEEEVTRERLAGAGLPIPADAPEFMRRDLFKVGNRDLTGADFTWLVGDWLSEHKTPEDIVVLERREWGNFYGLLVWLAWRRPARWWPKATLPGPSCKSALSVLKACRPSCTVCTRAISVRSTTVWSVCVCRSAGWSWMVS